MKSSPARLIAAVLMTCVVAAGSLAATYVMTAPRIAAQERAAEERALKAVLPGALEFVPVDGAVLSRCRDVSGRADVSGVYIASGQDGAQVGWGIKIASRGYGGPILLVMGWIRTGKWSALRSSP